MKIESITIRIDKYEKDQLKAIAKSLDMPMSHLIRQAIKEIIKKEGNNDNRTQPEDNNN